MIAYKAFNEDLTARMGKGRFQFAPGQIYEEQEANKGKEGFHCAENPLDCFGYYGIQPGDRYFKVEIFGDIDECDGDTAIAGTKIKLLEELTLKGMVEAFIEYMMNHPERDFIKQYGQCVAAREKAEVKGIGIAIAIGKAPVVKAGKGSVIAAVVEDENGVISGAWVAEVDGTDIKADKWYMINE